jgi:hypothetical protein
MILYSPLGVLNLLDLLLDELPQLRICVDLPCVPETPPVRLQLHDACPRLRDNDAGILKPFGVSIEESWESLWDHRGLAAVVLSE